jgi:hypothetical protein
MKLFFLLLLVISSFCSNTTNNQDDTDDETPLSQDFIKCLEKGKCGIESLCSFRFKKHHVSRSNDGTLDTSRSLDFCNSEIKPFQPIPVSLETKTKNDLCVPIAEGYIFSIANDMDYPIKFGWNVLDKGLDVNPKAKTKGTIFVPKKSIRYFTNGIPKTHKTQLYIQNQYVDESLALEAKKCTIDDTCDLLFRLCYQNQEDKDNYPSAVIDDAMCKIYKNECGGFSKRKNDREKDFQTYLKAYYPSYYISPNDITAESGQLQSDNILECIVQSESFKKFKSANGQLAGCTHTKDATTTDAGFITAIVLLSILILVLIVLIICWVPYCSPTYWRTRMVADNDVEIMETMRKKIQGAGEQIMDKLSQNTNSAPKNNQKKSILD